MSAHGRDASTQHPSELERATDAPTPVAAATPGRDEQDAADEAAAIGRRVLGDYEWRRNGGHLPPEQQRDTERAFWRGVAAGMLSPAGGGMHGWQPAPSGSSLSGHGLCVSGDAEGGEICACGGPWPCAEASDHPPSALPYDRPAYYSVRHRRNLTDPS